MANISFFDTIYHENPQTWHESIQNCVEEYCRLGNGRIMYAMNSRSCSQSTYDQYDLEVKNDTSSPLKFIVLTALKVTSIAIPIIPLAMLAAKTALRQGQSYTVKPNLLLLTGQSAGKFVPDLALGPLRNVTTGFDDIEGPDGEKNEGTIAKRFYETTDKVLLLEHCYKSYMDIIEDPSWQSPLALNFLYEELLGMRNSLYALMDDAAQIELEKLSCSSDESEEEQRDLRTISALGSNTRQLFENMEQSLKLLEEKIEPLDGPKEQSLFKGQDKSAVRGLRNAGNTCYINSALQPLLAIHGLKDLLPQTISTDLENYEERQKIFASFQNFFTAWEHGASVDRLGELVGSLRKEIFEAGLKEGGFVDPSAESSFQDAGQFFELILHVLGMGFNLEVCKTPLLEVGGMHLALEENQRVEETPQGVFYLQRPGESVQDLLNQYQDAFEQELTEGNEWRIEGREFSKIQETLKIQGQAPEILVIRVDQHTVNPNVDQRIDFAPLFKDAQENSQYELAGFSQNHHQVHWTSVVRLDDETWKYCNDSCIQSVGPEDPLFQQPCSYMVYRKIS